MIAKRAADLVLALAMLAVLSPLMLLVAAVVAITMGRPVLFTQFRPGLHGELFRIYKFRTMRDLRGLDGELLPDAERCTAAGKLLRAFSLDELPELLNVIRGDMSLVGPRPLLPEYRDRYTPEQARRHDVRPGITGLAQVSGRHAIPFSKRLEFDLRYVDNWTLLLDARILLATVPKVLGLRGVISDQSIDDIDDLGICPLSAEGRKRGEVKAGEQQ